MPFQPTVLQTEALCPPSFLEAQGVLGSRASCLPLLFFLPPEHLRLPGSPYIISPGELGKLRTFQGGASHSLGESRTGSPHWLVGWSWVGSPSWKGTWRGTLFICILPPPHLSPAKNKKYIGFLCCIANHPKLSRLKPHTFIILQPVSQEARHSVVGSSAVGPTRLQSWCCSGLHSHQRLSRGVTWPAAHLPRVSVELTVLRL